MRWIKFGAISGFVVLACILGCVIFSTIFLKDLTSGMVLGNISEGTDSLQSLKLIGIIDLIALVIFAAGTVFFIIGFKKTGEKLEAELLTFASKVFLGAFINIAILFVVLFALIFLGFSMLSTSFIKIWGILLLYLGAAFSASFVTMVVFGLGMIDIGDRVKFSKAAGIITSSFLAVLIFSFSCLATYIMVPTIFGIARLRGMIIEMNLGIFKWFSLVSIILSLISFLAVYLMGSLALLDASKQFENNPSYSSNSATPALPSVPAEKISFGGVRTD